MCLIEVKTGYNDGNKSLDSGVQAGLRCSYGLLEGKKLVSWMSECRRRGRC